MTISRERALNLVHVLGLIMIAVSILCGRLTLSKFAHSEANWGSIELANCLLIAALAIAAGLWFSGSLKPALKIRPLMILAALLFFLVALVVIDIVAHRRPDLSMVEETSRVFMILVALYLLLNDEGRIKQFMITIVAVGLVVTFGDFVGWRLQRLQLITGLSTSRINLLVLGTAVTLFLIARQKIWPAVATLAVFTLMSGPLKISMVAASAALFILVIGLLSANRFADTAKISAAVLLGVVLSVFSGSINNSLSRVETAYKNTSSQIILPLAASKKAPEVEENCQSSASPTYCESAFLVIPDPTERLRLFAHAVSLIKTAPLFGLGQNSYKLSLWYQVGDHGTLYVYLYPHNLLLDVGVTHGLVGVACLLALLSVCLIVVLSTFRDSFGSIGLLSAAAGIFLSAMTGGDFYDSRYIFVCAILAALIGSGGAQIRSPST